MTNSTAGPEKTYFDALAEGRFMLQRCAACERWVFYPRVLCPHCGARALEWREASGRGVVYATSVVRRRADDGGDHNVALIDLAEGPRLMSRRTAGKWMLSDTSAWLTAWMPSKPSRSIFCSPALLSPC